jgi:hypothetical protein
MSRLPIVVLAILLSGAAAASPIDGRWAWSSEGCNVAEGSGDVGPNVFSGDTLRYFESECKIVKIEPIGDQAAAWRAQTQCSGEGEEWTNDSVFAIDRDSDGNARQLVEVDMEDGFVTVLQACK